MPFIPLGYSQLLMGLFSSLFGSSKQSKIEAERQRVVESLFGQTSGAYTGEGQLQPFLQQLGSTGNYVTKVELLNKLYEAGRSPWADALLRTFAKDPEIPNTLLRAFVLDVFLAENRLEEFLDPARKILRDYPSETDLALALGRIEVSSKRYAEAISLLELPLESAPDSRHLFALIGEAHAGLQQDEEALIHLRASLELYEEAFKLQAIISDELQQEEYEYGRLYGLLEVVALRHLGAEKKAEAFATLKYNPEDIGLRKEADRLALLRVEFKPRRMAISNLAELERLQKTMGDGLGGEPQAAFLLGSRALRQRNFPEAITHFRKALELDMESHGAYYGWAACAELERVPLIPENLIAPLNPAEEQAYEQLFADWANLQENEKHLIQLSANPLRPFLPLLVEASAKVYLHPLDVRLRDVFADVQELSFEPQLRNPAVADAFTAKGKTHLRIDAFLLVSQKRAPLAYHLGQLSWNVLTPEDRAPLDEAFHAWEKGTPNAELKKVINNTREYWCHALVAAVQRTLLGQTTDETLVLPEL
ncbi:MAG: tetratricopeptide repeat protein [Candidatus Sumerlaeia bacterium]|nr:tetratricopeptide repeat protein [Candidatus Sumerlaeia bacterium]